MKKVLIILSVVVNAAFVVLLCAGVLRFGGNQGAAYCGEPTAEQCRKPFSVFSQPSVAEEILASYDSFAKEATGKTDVVEAYETLFFANADKIESAGDLDIFIPDSLHSDALTRKLITRTGIYVFWNGDRVSYRKAHRPQGEEYDLWSLEINPSVWAKYFQALRAGSAEREFWDDLTDMAVSAGDFPPSMFAEFLHRETNKIDFSKEAERFVIAYSFFREYASAPNRYKVDI